MYHLAVLPVGQPILLASLARSNHVERKIGSVWVELREHKIVKIGSTWEIEPIYTRSASVGS
jgi:hypothetical protein